MIKILGKIIASDILKSKYSSGSIERITTERMSESNVVYSYTTLNELEFELELRASIVNEAKALDASRLAFKTFRKSLCNTEFWIRTDEGGFLLKQDANPSYAIKDIFVNGRKYGTECATAIIIVFYGAIADKFTEGQYNRLFNSIHLMNWKRLDSNLGVKTYDNIVDELPGDCIYFKNPDVDLLKPEWKGENAIVLGDGTYYGHGIGIANSSRIINVLNKHRKGEATISAYRLDTATRLGFKYLSQIRH